MRLRYATLLLLGIFCGCAEPLGGLTIFGAAHGGPCLPGVQKLQGLLPIEVAAEQGSLVEVTVSLNNESPTTLVSNPFRLEVNTADFPDGLLLIVAKGLDEEGNIDLTTAEICVDNHDPDLEVLSPAEGDKVYQEDNRLEVLVHAADTVGIQQITAEVQLSGSQETVDCDPVTGPDATCTLHPSAMGLNLKPGPPEPAALTVTVTDTAGHQTHRTLSLDWTTRLLWERDLFASVGQGIPYAVELIPGSGNLVVATSSDDPLAGAVRVLDPGGNPLCEYPTIINSPPTVSDESGQIIFTSDAALISISAANCKENWSRPGAFLFSRPVLSKSSIFIGRNGKAEGTGAGPAVLASYNLATGAPQGSIVISANNGDLAPAWPVLSGNTVYIGSVDSSLYAINVTNPAAMTTRWTYRTGGAVLTRATLTSDRLYLAGLDSFIHAITPATGDKIEGFSFQANAFRTDMAVSADEEVIYAACTDRLLYALDQRGQVLSKLEVGRTVSNASHPFTTRYSAPVIGPGGVVFQACTTAKKDSPCGLNALSPEQLEPLWFWDAEPDQQRGMTFLATPTLSGNVLYIGSYKGTLYAFDASRSTTN